MAKLAASEAATFIAHQVTPHTGACAEIVISKGPGFVVEVNVVSTESTSRCRSREV